MRNYNAKDVDAYIANSSAEARPTMQELRKIIKASVPEAEEGISWGVPFYKHHGLLGGFAVFKNHISFGLAFVLENKDRKTLKEKGYETGKKTVQIRFDQKIPVTSIKKILKAKAKVNEVRARKV